MINGWRVLFFIVCAALWTQIAQGEDWGFQHLLDLRFLHQNLRDTYLTPSPDWLDFQSNRGAATYRLDFSKSVGAPKIKGTARLQFDTVASPKTRLRIDTLSAELDISKSAYVFAGRRHFAQGTAYGLNPADVFLDVLAEDHSLNEARRRIETKGVDAVGSEVYISDRVTLLGFIAPEWGFLNKGKRLRADLSATLLAPDINTDFTFSLFKEKRPGGALSISKTIGNSVVLYMDTTIRQNRSRALPIKSAIPGEFTLDDPKNGDWYFAGTVGLGKTFETGVTFNLEYSRQGDGYNAKEWKNISQLIDENFKAWRNGPTPALGRGNLMTLNKALRSETLRQNYVFGRIFFPQVMNLGASLEGVVLHNLDDKSGILVLRSETEIAHSTTLGLCSSRPYGSRRSEFGLRSPGLMVGGYVTVNF